MRLLLARLSAACFALTCLACLGSEPAWAKDSVPDWVRAAALVAHTFPHETNAAVLLDEIRMTVDKDGRAVEHRRRVVKILRAEGRDEGMVFVSFNKDTKLLSLRIWSLSPDGHEYAMRDNEISEHGFPGEGSLYDDDRYKEASPPGRDVGGVIAYEYDQRVSPYVNEKTWFFQDDIPHVSQSFTLELPPGYSYGTVWAHHTKEPELDLEHGRYRWELNDVPAIDLRHVLLRPSELSLTGRMTVYFAGPSTHAASLGTWAGIGEWYGGLLKGRTDASPEMAAKAAELTAGKTDFYDKTEVLAEFVQKQVRYFVIEMGIGGYQPHAAGEIFRNRYGDCKDKANLLSAMLGTVGVHGALMMVDHRRGVLDPAAPSTVGDHMIAAIEIPAGYQSPRMRSVVTAATGKRYLIVDPTSEKTPFGQLEHELQGGYGLLFEPGASEILALPVLQPEFNAIHRNASFSLSADGVLEGIVKEGRFGDVAGYKREVYTSETEKERDAFETRALGGDFPVFSAKDYRVNHVLALNEELTTEFTLGVKGYGRVMGPLMMVRPRVLGVTGLVADHSAREVPVDLRETRLENDDFTIELPAEYVLDELPAPVKLDMGFAAYESSSEVKGRTLHYRRTYTVREVVVPAGRYSDVQKLAATIAADEQSRAVLKKGVEGAKR